MIADQMLFGLNMERRQDRRILVLGYCGFTLAFLILGLLWNRGLLFGNLAGTLLIGGGLGGIRGGGPVKKFNGREIPSDDLSTTTASFPVQTLNLQGQLPRADQIVHLDERETTERDRAHFTAFRLLRWTHDELRPCVSLATVDSRSEPAATCIALDRAGRSRLTPRAAMNQRGIITYALLLAAPTLVRPPRRTRSAYA